MVVCGDAGEALGDSLYEAVIYVRGKIRSLGADARFEPMSGRRLRGRGGVAANAGSSMRRREFQARRPRRAEPVSLERRREPGVLDGYRTMTEACPICRHLQLEESAGYDRHVIDYIQRAAATGLYEIRGLGAKRRLPHFDDLRVPRRLAVALSARGLSREMHHANRARHALRDEAASSSTSRSPSRA